MERTPKGTFAKGHTGWNKGMGWKNETRTCKCGKNFNPRKKYQKSCSQHCAMVGTQRRLGAKHSKETKLVIAEKARKQHADGRITDKQRFAKGSTPPHKGKQRPEISGENHWNWNGGVTKPNERVRKSLEYKQWRTAVFKRDNYTCVLCGERGGTLQADHIQRFSDFPELRLVLSNGRTLCKSCHLKTETYGTRKKE